MPHYRKHSVVIEAFRLGIDDMPDWFCTKVSRNDIVTHGTYAHLTHCDIHTRDGVIRGQRGDYILKGVHGDISPCTAAVFAATYERVED